MDLSEGAVSHHLQHQQAKQGSLPRFFGKQTHHKLQLIDGSIELLKPIGKIGVAGDFADVLERRELEMLPVGFVAL